MRLSECLLSPTQWSKAVCVVFSEAALASVNVDSGFGSNSLPQHALHIFLIFLSDLFQTAFYEGAHTFMVISINGINYLTVSK